MKNKKVIISLVSMIILAGGIVAYLFASNSNSEYVFDTVVLKKGSINNTVTATGTLEATNTVTVGTQVSGVIEKLYVDFNSKVKKGQLIAELDKSTLQSTFETVEADLASAQAEFEYQKANYDRMKVLFDKELLAESDYDLVKYNYKNSVAKVKSAIANLNKAKLNLSYATIYSPIDGIVINRAVEEGQTVTASMSTPELYTIANDLTVMQVEADVDEADIGMVKTGQRVEFTVDAFPDDIFSGEVSEVRLQAVETSNVVTYTVIVKAQNPEFKLMPGMTASITDYVEEVNDILLLAGKAFRFSPDREMMNDYMSNLSDNNQLERSGRNNTGSNSSIASRKGSRPDQDLEDDKKLVWVKQGNLIKPVVVEIGVTDGINIQVLSGLNENDAIVTAMSLGKKDSGEEKEETSTQKSPFVQERPRGGGPR
ncbi:efflux RND transporter periplasmic adaptor subunit [Marinifilum sp. N1E240]|uniref:efflux RND transporter periplasmic adaptor subunit n=1 Tax=Marinifilum sp. N1E240 TaxID=2608082 RepID=UPI00128B4679|nr:efflux RND transporter periplasmic adaptor subunit [Marinifilum sp. N1E240]MPQ46917.1 efflux RND transporter periplasmic adaptor subunit [Marinifilum sp. N1E240]